MESLKLVARERLADGQEALDLGLHGAVPGQGGPLQIVSSRMGYLWDALSGTYRVLGFQAAAGGDVRCSGHWRSPGYTSPVSKLDWLRVLTEVGVAAPSYSTVKRRLPGYTKPEFREALAGRVRPGRC